MELGDAGVEMPGTYESTKTLRADKILEQVSAAERTKIAHVQAVLERYEALRTEYGRRSPSPIRRPEQPETPCPPCPSSTPGRSVLCGFQSCGGKFTPTTLSCWSTDMDLKKTYGSSGETAGSGMRSACL